MAVFAVLVVTAAVQTSRNSVSDERDRARAGRPGERRPATSSRPTRPGSRELRAESAALESRQLRNDASAQGLLANLELLG